MRRVSAPRLARVIAAGVAKHVRVNLEGIKPGRLAVLLQIVARLNGVPCSLRKILSYSETILRRILR